MLCGLGFWGLGLLTFRGLEAFRLCRVWNVGFVLSDCGLRVKRDPDQARM